MKKFRTILFLFLAAISHFSLLAQKSDSAVSETKEKIQLNFEIKSALKEFKLGASFDKNMDSSSLFNYNVPANFSCWNPIHMRNLRDRRTFLI